MMRVDIITPFPKLLEAFSSESIIKRACEKGIVTIKTWDLRDFTTDKHKTVDDYPYGGGPGMIMKPEPIFNAVEHILKDIPGTKPRVIYMSPQGERYSQELAFQLTKGKHLIFICGHYRGVDERIIESLVTDEISIGDYILTGGELPAAVVVDSVVRLLPGVLGDSDSAEGDSFNRGMLDHPHYTRPSVFRGLNVPQVLLSGHHSQVKEWREEQALLRTRKKRPDLIEKNGSKTHVININEK
jgi:tRNA (guanine37-N1)-methyltransferase